MSLKKFYEEFAIFSFNLATLRCLYLMRKIMRNDEKLIQFVNIFELRNSQKNKQTRNEKKNKKIRKKISQTKHKTAKRQLAASEKFVTYNVLDAKFVSSCFNWPSSARPHLSLLFANKGVSVKTFESVKPGWTELPSL